MRFSLRTLLILMLIAGPLSLLGWNQWHAYQERLAQELARRALRITTRQRFVVTGPSQTIGGVTGSAAELEIWRQQREKISWESFPESTPAPC